GGVGYITGMFFGSQFAPGGVGTLIGRGIVGPDAFEWVALIGSVFLILIILQNPNGLAPGHVVKGRPKGVRAALLPTLYLSYAVQRLTAAPKQGKVDRPQGERAPREPLPLVVHGASVNFG